MIEESKLAELEAKYGRIKYVVYNGIDLVLRKPTRSECHDHTIKSTAESPHEKVVADEQLAQLLIVQVGDVEGAPCKQEFLNLLDDYPYLIKEASFGDALAKLTGVVQDAEAKKYGSTSRSNGATRVLTPTA